MGGHDARHGVIARGVTHACRDRLAVWAVFHDMTLAPRRSGLVLVFALAFGSFTPSPARADEPAKELKVPPAPSQELADILAAGKKALPTELHPAFAAVVADARARLLASERAAADGTGERLSVESAARAALLAADFAGVSKKKGKVVEGLVALAALQLTFDLRAALRESIGRQLAIRSVRACKDAVACLDAIAATPDMPAYHVEAVRKQFDGKMKELEAQDRLGNFEIQRLSSTISRVKTSDKHAKAVLDFIKG